MKWLFHSLIGRILLTIVLVHMLLVPILFFHLLHTVEENYKNQFVDQVRADAQWMASYIAGLGERKQIQSFLNELTISGKRVYIRVFDMQGRLQAETGQVPPAQREISADDFYFGQGEDAIYNISSMVNDKRGDQIATLYVGYDESATRGEIALAYQRGGMLALAYFLVALVITITFSRYLFRNLQHIRDAAHRIASGHFEERIEPRSRLTELVAFSRDLESMRRQLVKRGQQLAERERRMRAVVDNIADGIVVFDAHGRIESCNPAMRKIFACDETDLEGASVFDILRMPGRKLDIQRLLCVGAMELIGIRRDGQELIIEASLSELKQDQESRFLAVLRDITERRATEQELARHRAELAHAGRLSSMGEIAAGLAHELNQPLAAISMYIQGSIQRLSGMPAVDAGIIHAMEAAGLQSQRAAEIIRRIRSFVRKEPPQAEYRQINDLVRQALDLIELDIREHDILVRSALSSLLPAVRVDALQIKQVLVNLLRNAIDAIVSDPGAPAELTIRTGLTPDRHVLVSIEDRAQGVPAELQEQLFETFVTSKPDGLGIGLAISRSIIEEHGGGIGYCDNPAGGSIFSFSLPVEKEKNND